MRFHVIVLAAVAAALSPAVADAQGARARGPVVLSSDPLVYEGVRPPLPPSLAGSGLGAVWRGLRVAPESACSPFSDGDYGVSDAGRFVPYAFAAGVVGGRDPLTCAHAAGSLVDPPRRSRLVTVEEAHRRGLCGRSPTYRRHFVVDSGNVLPSEIPARVLFGRGQLGPGWLPPFNQCWYVASRVRVHQRWGLSIPLEEARRFQAVLETCPASERVSPSCGTSTGGFVPR